MSRDNQHLVLNKTLDYAKINIRFEVGESPLFAFIKKNAPKQN